MNKSNYYEKLRNKTLDKYTVVDPKPKVSNRLICNALRNYHVVNTYSNVTMDIVKEIAIIYCIGIDRVKAVCNENNIIING